MTALKIMEKDKVCNYSLIIGVTPKQRDITKKDKWNKEMLVTPFC